MAAVSPPALQAVGPAAYLQALLAEREAPYYLRLQRRPLEKVYARLVERTPDGGFFGGEPELTRSLLGIVDDLLGARNTLQAHLVAQETLIRDADDRQAHRMLVLETARVLGAGPLALRADAQALGRDLDWPGMRERAKHRVNTLSRTLQATLIVLRNLVAVMGETEADRLNLIEELMLCALSLLDQPQHPLLARESVRFAGEVLRLYGAERALPHKRLEEELLVRARDPRRDVWVQCHALQALAATAPDAAQALTTAAEKVRSTHFAPPLLLTELLRSGLIVDLPRFKSRLLQRLTAS